MIISTTLKLPNSQTLRLYLRSFLRLSVLAILLISGRAPMGRGGNNKILYGKYSGTEITYEGKEYLIMRESDIYAVL